MFSVFSKVQNPNVRFEIVHLGYCFVRKLLLPFSIPNEVLQTAVKCKQKKYNTIRQARLTRHSRLYTIFDQQCNQQHLRSLPSICSASHIIRISAVHHTIPAAAVPPSCPAPSSCSSSLNFKTAVNTSFATSISFIPISMMCSNATSSSAAP